MRASLGLPDLHVDDCDDEACESVQVADLVYTTFAPTHAHAHHMNENPCGGCEHGARYHADGCIVPSCECPE